MDCAGEFVLGQVLIGEVSEGTVRVLWRVLILPRLVRFVIGPLNDVFELVLTCMSHSLHCICAAKLSRLSVLANEDCCSFGSIAQSINTMISYNIVSVAIMLL